MKFPFEAQPDEVLNEPESFVDAVFSSLASEFLVMPKGEGFLDYSIFAAAYETLKKASDGFTRIERSAILSVALQCPVVLIVLRAILGFTPPEWAYIASSRKGVDIPQNAARTLDRSIRSSPSRALKPGATTLARIAALVETACDLIVEAAPLCLRISCTASARRTVWRGCLPSNSWPILARPMRCYFTSGSSEDHSPAIGTPSVN